MQGRICRNLWLIAALLLLFSALAMPAAAETPDYISLVSSPTDPLKDVYYCEGKDTSKRAPDKLTWEPGRNDGQALVLNGKDQYMRLATARVKKLTSFTFASWVRWNGEGGNTLLTFYRNENYCLTVSMRGKNETDGLSVKLVLPDRDPLVLTKTAPEGSTFAFPTNEWHHIAVSVSAAELTVYVDGVAYLSQPIELDFKAVALDKFRIGTGLTPKPALGAAFQDARLYTTVLPADQIALLAQDKEPGSGETTTTGTLATRPAVTTTTAVVQNGISSLGDANEGGTLFDLPVGMFITLGVIVLGVVTLSIIFSIQGNQKPSEKEGE